MKKTFFSLLFLISAVTFSQQSTANVKIILTDVDSIAEANAKVKIYSTDKTFNFEGVTNDLGFLPIKLPLGKELKLDIYRYDTVFNFAQTIPVGNYGEYEIPFHLQIQVIRNVIKNYKMPVFFESGKSDVTPESSSAIDDLFKQMSSQKDMNIEIGAHTDNIGSETYNQQLSQQRAASIRNHLIKKGIDGKRIIAKGYGESKPIGDNNTEEGRALNRRVEITVTQQQAKK